MNKPNSFYESDRGASRLPPRAAQTKEFTLITGRTVKFFSKTIPAEKVETDTFVDLEVNDRLQDEITEASLQKVLKTIGTQQFYPAVGYMADDGRISICDGSRRRRGTIIKKVDLDVLYSKEKLTVAEAKALSEDLSSSEKHSYRDLGCKFQRLKDVHGLSGKEISAEYGFSEAHVSTCLMAWSIDQRIVLAFDNPLELGQQDFRKLQAVQKAVGDSGEDIDEFLAQVQASEEYLSLSDDTDKKKSLLSLLDKIAFASEAKSNKVKYEPILSFNKNKYVRKKNVGKKVVIEFARIPQAKMEEIEKFIQKSLRSDDK